MKALVVNLEGRRGQSEGREDVREGGGREGGRGEEDRGIRKEGTMGHNP